MEAIQAVFNCKTLDPSNPAICQICELGYSLKNNNRTCELEIDCSYSDINCIFEFETQFYDHEILILFAVLTGFSLLYFDDYTACYALFYFKFLVTIDYKSYQEEIDLNLMQYVIRFDQYRNLLEGKFIVVLFLLVIGLILKLLFSPWVRKIENRFLKHIFYYFVFNYAYIVFFNFTVFIFDENLYFYKESTDKLEKAILVIQIIIVVIVHILVAYNYSSYVFEQNKPKMKALNVQKGRAVSRMNAEIFKIRFRGDMQEIQVLDKSFTDNINFQPAAIIIVLRALLFAFIKNFFQFT